MTKERGAKCFIPEIQFLVDNAAMIALTGYLMYKGGYKLKKSKPEIYPYQRTDQVDVTWT